MVQGKRKAASDLYFSEVYSGLEARAEVDVLDPGIDYHFRVHAINSRGPSLHSATRAPCTLLQHCTS